MRGIALVTINRPDKLNALSGAVVAELRRAFEHIARDAYIRGAILTGAGEKAFVAGADINELAQLSAFEAREFALRGQQTFRMLETMPKPSVAAINGYALGGGLELAMACTVRFAAETRQDGAAGSEARHHLPAMAARSGCRAWWAADARWNCCSRARPSPPRKRIASVLVNAVVPQAGIV